MNIRKLFILPALFVALTSVAQEATLRIQVVENTKYDLDISSVMDITQNMSGIEMKVHASSVGKATMEIEKVESDGSFVALSTWKEMLVKSSAMGQDTTIHFNDLNFQLRTIYSRNGEILSNKIVEIATDPTIGAALAQLATGVKLPVLSDETVKKGDVWNHQTNDTIEAMGAPFPMLTVADEEYTYMGFETKEGQECHRIAVEGPMKITGEGEQMGMAMALEGNGMSEGYSLHDKATLFPVYIDLKVGFDMSIVISGAQSMAIPMTQNMTTTISFVEVK